MTFQYPLKLISPSPSAEQKSVLVFLLTYGGGLVGGDQVHLKIDVNPNAKLSIVTQGHTKIFKSSTREVITRQKLQVTIEDGASVCLLPDPVQPFAGSVYEQSQTFIIKGGGSLFEKLSTFFLSEFAALPRIGARDFRSDDKKERDNEVILSRHESWRLRRLRQEKDEGILWSAAKVRGCTVVKFGAPTVESGRVWIGGMIKEECSISEIFGEDSLMCVR
ncbi:hypothetical protein DID88_007000 [Monilinia fructigena]|uniref:Urease accessory protein UreD n=1 Tax=Monilinia fructigena TaxID=38457 RepID=A0A395IFZ1_9HELO|nr:hypothetical protein DID88_007000 [Monilinia fructigena]